MRAIVKKGISAQVAELIKPGDFDRAYKFLMVYKLLKELSSDLTISKEEGDAFSQSLSDAFKQFIKAYTLKSG